MRLDSSRGQRVLFEVEFPLGLIFALLWLGRNGLSWIGYGLYLVGLAQMLQFRLDGAL